MLARLALFAFAAGLLGGCAAQRQLPREQRLRLHAEAQRDSLALLLASQRTLQSALRDSLQFYDDIDSGAYERRLRVLNDRIRAYEFQNADAPLNLGTPVDTLYADELFEPASATLSASGGATLDRLARSLGQAGRLRIEGHADSSPIGPNLRARFDSNWELAAGRAAAVARYLIGTGMDAARFDVVSRGETDPLATNATAAGRAQNRRIVVYRL
jgi:flagellar motor protein MotB